MFCHRLININADSFSTMASQTLSTSYSIMEVNALIAATLRAVWRQRKLAWQTLLFHIEPRWALKGAKKKSCKDRIRVCKTLSPERGTL